MKAFIKKGIKKGFNAFGIELSHYSKNGSIQNESANLIYAFERLKFLLTNRDHADKDKFSPDDFLAKSMDKLSISKGQLFQDLFVLYCTGNKQNGFFVEFGATDGVHFSNTFLLEKKYNWKGILAEPAKVWHSRLQANRACFIENECVWTKSGETLVFNEVSIAELSTIKAYTDSDFHSTTRDEKKTYTVSSISLTHLLEKYNAPYNIDYLSIDTEGSEYDILCAFDFSKYNISIITVEHNYTDHRNAIHELLVKHNYKRVFEEISLFDDWYIKQDIVL